MLDDDDDGRNIIHDAPYCNNDDSSRLRSMRENISEDDDDDNYNGKRITNIMLAQLSEIGHTVWKSTMVMTRPLFVGIVSMDNHHSSNDNNGKSSDGRIDLAVLIVKTKGWIPMYEMREFCPDDGIGLRPYLSFMSGLARALTPLSGTRAEVGKKRNSR